MSTENSALPAPGGGVIHDIGYRHYTGPRLGRPGIVRALVWHSLRSSVGIGRGAKAKIIPVIAFVAMCLPAVVNAVSVAEGGHRLVPYDTYIFQLRVLIMIIFVAAQAPELVSRDLRSHVLPLYFSRPMQPARLPAGQAHRVHPGLPGADRDPAAAALPGHDRVGGRPQRRSGTRPGR